MTAQGSGLSRRRDGWVAIKSAAAVGILINFLVHLNSGVDTDPPECYSVIGYVVPCNRGIAYPLALAGFAIVGVVVYVLRRRQQQVIEHRATTGR